MTKNTTFYVILGFIVGSAIFAGLYFSAGQETDNGYSMVEDQQQQTTQLSNDEIALVGDDSQPLVQGDQSAKAADTYEKQDNSLNNQKINMTVQDKLNVQKPEMSIDKTKKYTAVMKTTEGDIKLELFADKTPVTVNNFVALSKMGFYNDVIFHRVIKDFMIQSGDPAGNGSGGPAYRFDDESFDGEYTKGTLAMANAGPNTNGSQFFIMHGDTPLPKNYVIFGNVTEGMDVVDKIATAPVSVSPMGEQSKPVNPVKITGVEILEQ